jgi:hypothetical protein
MKYNIRFKLAYIEDNIEYMKHRKYKKLKNSIAFVSYIVANKTKIGIVSTTYSTCRHF